MSLKKQLLSYTLIFLIGTIISKFSVFAFRAILAQELSLEEYGQISLMTRIYATVIVLAHFQVDPSINFYLSKLDKRDYGKLVFNSLLMIVPTTLLAALVASYLLLQKDILNGPLLACFIIAVIIMEPLLEYNAGILRFLKRIKSCSAAYAMIGVFRLLICMFLFYVFGQRNYESAALAFIFSFTIPIIVSVLFAWDILKLVQPKVDFGILRNLYGYSFAVVVAYFYNNLFALVPAWVLSKSDFAEVAYLDVAILGITIFSMLFSFIPYNASSLISSKSQELRLPAILDQYFVGLSVAFVVVVAGLASTSPAEFVVSKVFGKGFLPALPIFQILTLALPFSLFYTLITGVLMGVNRLRMLVFIDTFVVALTIVTVYWLSSEGVIIVSIATTTGVVLRSITGGVYYYWLRAKLASEQQ